MCGGSDLLKHDGAFVCQSCGTKYSVEEAKKMMIEGTVEVAGTVKVDNSAKLDNLYKLARRAKDDFNSEKGLEVYEQIAIEDPNSWEAAFFIIFYSAHIKYKNDETNAAINSLKNGLDSVFDLIEPIDDYEELQSAIKEIVSKTGIISELLFEDTEKYYKETKNRIYDHQNNGTLSGGQAYKYKSNNSDLRKSRKDGLKEIQDILVKRQTRIDEVIGKRRFDEYWDAHQSEKAELEAEKKSLSAQVTDINQEILKITQNTDGYANMVEFQKKVQNLTSEKDALGILKRKEKKALQEQIDSANNAIAPIQSRINSAIAGEQGRITSLQGRIAEIDTELTKPR